MSFLGFYFLLITSMYSTPALSATTYADNKNSTTFNVAPEGRTSRFATIPFNILSTSSSKTKISYDNPFDNGLSLDERLRHTTMIDFDDDDDNITARVPVKCTQIDRAYCNYPDIPLLETNNLNSLLSSTKQHYGLQSGQCPATHTKRPTFDCLAPSTLVEVTCCVPHVRVSKSICDHLGTFNGGEGDNNNNNKPGENNIVNAIFRTCGGRYFMITDEYAFEFDEEFRILAGPTHVAWLTAGGILHGSEIVGAGTLSDCRTAFAKTNGNMILVDVEGRRETQHVTRELLGLAPYESIVGMYCPREGYCTVLTQVSAEVKTELGLINWYVLAPNSVKNPERPEQHQQPWLVEVEPKNHLNALYNITAAEYLEHRRLLLFIDGRLNVYFFEPDGRLALYNKVPGAMNPVSLLKLIRQCDHNNVNGLEEKSNTNANADDDEHQQKTVIVYAPYPAPPSNQHQQHLENSYVVNPVETPTPIVDYTDPVPNSNDFGKTVHWPSYDETQKSTTKYSENGEDNSNSGGDYSSLYMDQLHSLARLLNKSPVMKLYGSRRPSKKKKLHQSYITHGGVSPSTTIININKFSAADGTHHNKEEHHDGQRLYSRSENEEEREYLPVVSGSQSRYTPPIINKILVDKQPRRQPGGKHYKKHISPAETEPSKINAYINGADHDDVKQTLDYDEDETGRKHLDKTGTNSKNLRQFQNSNSDGGSKNGDAEKRHRNKQEYQERLEKVAAETDDDKPDKNRIAERHIDPSAFPSGPVPLPPPVPPDLNLPLGAQQWQRPAHYGGNNNHHPHYGNFNGPPPVFFGGGLPPPPLPFGGFGFSRGFVAGGGGFGGGGGFHPPPPQMLPPPPHTSDTPPIPAEKRYVPPQPPTPKERPEVHHDFYGAKINNKDIITRQRPSHDDDDDDNGGEHWQRRSGFHAEKRYYGSEQEGERNEED